MPATFGITGLQFQDVYSLDGPDLLVMVPRPVLAPILVFPASAMYAKQIASKESDRPVYTGSGPEEDVVWLKQTIHNACGLYGILHAVSNGPGEVRHFISELCSKWCTPPTLMTKSCRTRFFTREPPHCGTTCVALKPRDRAIALEDSMALETSHADAAIQGDSAVPTNAEDEVEFHYVCFVHGIQLQVKGEVGKGLTERFCASPKGSRPDLYYNCYCA
jgi:ubiquitin carboxyl-terminal hydrolase L3